MSDIPKSKNKNLINLYGALILTPLGILIIVVLSHLLSSGIRLSDYPIVFWKTASHPLVLIFFAHYLFGIIMPVTYLVWRKRKKDFSGTNDKD